MEGISVETLSHYSMVTYLCIIWDTWIGITADISKVVIYTSNILIFLSSATLGNSFLLISFTYLIINKASTLVYALQINLFGIANLVSALLKDRNSIFRIISILV